MEDIKKDKGLEKKIKYVPPELISLDKDEGAEGGALCFAGSGAGAGGCNPGAVGVAG